MTPATIRELIDANATRSPEALFALDPETGHSITFGQLQQHARRVAVFIDQQDVPPGDSVAFALSNSAAAAACLLGILYGGYRLTAINLVAGRNTLAYVLQHSDTRLVLTDATQRQLLLDALALNESGVAPRLVDTGYDWLASLPDAPPRFRSSAADDDGLLMYTSGTTGTPKGVVLTQSSLIAAGRNVTLSHRLSSDDRALCVLPFYHINGLCTTLLGPLFSGGSVVTPPRYSTGQFWSWMRHQQCTWFSAVPTHYSYLLHAPDNSDQQAIRAGRIRFGRSASAPLSPDVQQAFEQRYGVPIVETMGLTETAGQILSNPLPPGTRKLGSPGVAIGDEVIITDTHGDEVPHGTEGEIRVRGPNIMNRYLKNDEATADALRPGGWLCTGDLGRMDDEGYVFVTGRLKELIIRGGENIAPREIDEVLYRHPDVVEAAAFACHCPRYGQRVEAAVSLRDGADVDESVLLALCRELIGPMKTPERIHFLDELPKGPSGKIQRRILSESFDQPLANQRSS